MKIQIIQVPYDSGYRDLRQGCGPAHFIDQNLAGMLEADGHQIRTTRIEAKAEFTTEIGTAFELNRLLSGEVKAAVESGSFPLVLAGNCNSCLGTIAGINSTMLGVVWFDAHGEFNTPETTRSGFLDGMPLAMATGRCWKAILETIEAVIAKVKRYFKIRAATVASFDPIFDPSGKFLSAGIGCIHQIVSA